MYRTMTKMCVIVWHHVMVLNDHHHHIMSFVLTLAPGNYNITWKWVSFGDREEYLPPWNLFDLSKYRKVDIKLMLKGKIYVNRNLVIKGLKEFGCHVLQIEHWLLLKWFYLNRGINWISWWNYFIFSCIDFIGRLFEVVFYYSNFYIISICYIIILTLYP